MNELPLIREEFKLDADWITRQLSVNGVSGLSSFGPVEQIPNGLPQESLQSLWDGLFLRDTVVYPRPERHSRVVRIADVFCGAGGLSYGIREAIRACGLRCHNIMAADIDQVAIDVYRRNIDPAVFSGRNLWTSVTKSYSTRKDGAVFSSTPKLVAEDLLFAEGKVDILLGGPPCEGHSTSNNITRRNDPRNRYYIIMPAMAVALGASAVIVENVPGVVHDHRNVLDNAKSLFETSGYYVDEAIVDSITLGLPQTRKRHILVASKVRKPCLLAGINYLRRPQRDLRWAIGDMMQIASTGLFDNGAELSDVNRHRIKYLFDNDEYDLPNEHRPDSHKNGHTYPSIYGRLRWDRPSGTITTGFNTPGRGRYIHPELQRTITPHEAARIQGFPDTFEFKTIDGETPTRTSLANMIGDAVPPQIGYLAGVTALAAMNLDSLPKSVS